MPDDTPALRGLLVDWGGVLTSGLNDALGRWAELDDLDFDAYYQAMVGWLAAAAGRSRAESDPRA